MGELHAVIVVVDGLRADALGTYGNARAVTPFLDHLAAESTVYDFAYCLNPAIASYYRSAILGVHPAYEYSGSPHPGIARSMSVMSCGPVRHCLFTDEPTVAEIDLDPFAWSATGSYSIANPAAGSGGLPMPDEFFSAAARWLNEDLAATGGAATIGWVHTSLRPLRTALGTRSADELGSPIGAGSPHRDEITRYLFGRNQSLAAALRDYAAAVTRLDDGVGMLFAEISQSAARGMFVVTAPRGYALGERGYVGRELPQLHEELLHVPLIVFRAAASHGQTRDGRLISPLDIMDLLYPGPTEASRPDATAPAECLFFANSLGDRALRTPSWYLIHPAVTVEEEGTRLDSQAPRELYLKPDDRLEFNEISARAPQHVVEALDERLGELSGQAYAGGPLNLRGLPPDVLERGT